MVLNFLDRIIWDLYVVNNFVQHVHWLKTRLNKGTGEFVTSLIFNNI